MVLLKNSDVFYIQLQHVNIMISDSVSVTTTRSSAAAGVREQNQFRLNEAAQRPESIYHRVKQTSFRFVTRMMSREFCDGGESSVMEERVL